MEPPNNRLLCFVRKIPISHKTGSLIIIFLLSGFFSGNIFAQTVGDKKLTPREIARKILPSTVSIAMGNPGSDEINTGSGFFVADDVVVTNFHVIEGKAEGFVKAYGNETLYRILGTVGIDQKNDLALLKIDKSKGQPLSLNVDDSIAIGDEVFAVGNPKGLEGTFSQGIVSNLRKTEKRNLLQITASISHGSSGGPILNDRGEVVGVAVGAIEDGQSLNFAIPASLLRNLLSKRGSLTALPRNPPANGTNSTEPRKVDKNATQPDRSSPKTPQIPIGNRFQYKDPDTIERNLSGRVRSLLETKYNPKKKFDDWVLGDPILISTTNFNSDGHTEVSQESLYSYDGLDFFDFFEHLAVMFDCDALPSSFKQILKYDYSGGIVTTDNFRGCSTDKFKLFSTIIVRYDANEKTIFDPDRSIRAKKTTRYLKDGTKVIEDFDGSGKLQSTETIYSGKAGTIREMKLPDEGHFIKTVITESDKFIKETSRCQTKGVESDCGFILLNKLTKLIVREERGETIKTYEYEFDGSGNWTKKTEYEQVKKFGKIELEPRKVWTREITYY